MNDEVLKEIESRYPDADPIDADVRRLIAEIRGLVLQVGHYKDALERIASGDWTDPADGLACDADLIAKWGLKMSDKLKSEGA